MSELRPTDGARFLLERASIDPDGEAASYRGAIYLPDDERTYAVRVSSAGEATLDGGGAWPEHEARLIDLARSLGRSAPRRKADGLPTWPERMLRWRGPGRG